MGIEQEHTEMAFDEQVVMGILGQEADSGKTAEILFDLGEVGGDQVTNVIELAKINATDDRVAFLESVEAKLAELREGDNQAAEEGAEDYAAYSVRAFD